MARNNIAICLALTLLSPAQSRMPRRPNRLMARTIHGAREIVDRVARLFSGKSSIATLEMQISNEDGAT